MAERWQYTIFTFLCIVSTATLIICLFAIYKIRCKSKIPTDSPTAVYMTLMCIILHSINSVLDPIGFYFYVISPDDDINTTVYNAWSSTWTMSKLSLYLVYIYRLHLTVKGTPYSYSLAVYCPITALWITQCTLMIFYISVRSSIAEDSALALFTSTTFILFDFILIIAVMLLFIVPISKLIKSLRQNEENVIVPKHVFNASIDIDELLNENEGTLSQQNVDSMDFAIMSKTYKEANDNNESKKYHQNQSIASMSSSFRANIMSHELMKFQPKEHTLSTLRSERYGSMEIVSTRKNPKWNLKQQILLGFVTRLGLLAVISLISSFLYQITWIISVSTNHEMTRIYWFTYTWNVDTLINVFCLYLSCRVTNDVYEKCCIEWCQWHQSCMKCVQFMV